MDECDCAQIYIEEGTAESIRAIRSRMASDEEALTECENCGDDIPEARRLAAPGCRLCVSCQLAYERRAAS